MRSENSKQLVVDIMHQCNNSAGGDVIIALADALGMALVALSDTREQAVHGYALATNLVKSWITEDADYGHGIRRVQ